MSGQDKNNQNMLPRGREGPDFPARDNADTEWCQEMADLNIIIHRGLWSELVWGLRGLTRAHFLWSPGSRDTLPMLWRDRRHLIF